MERVRRRPRVGDKLGPFRVVENIGFGGMAEVLLGARSVGGVRELAAIKKLLPHLSGNAHLNTMLEREGALLSELCHENIPTVQFAGQTQFGYCIASEYVNGVDLQEVLKLSAQSHLVSIEFALGVTIEVAKALAYAHEFRGQAIQGLIHRDVSPSNVRVHYDGRVSLLDFGIARTASLPTLTQRGEVKGKVGYMSPEQCRGDRPDHRTDLFSLGALLYEAATLHRLFRGVSRYEVIAKTHRGQFRDPEALPNAAPPAVCKIIRSLLQVDADERPISARDVVQSLQECASSLGLEVSAQGRQRHLEQLVEPLSSPSVPNETGGRLGRPPLRTRPSSGWIRSLLRPLLRKPSAASKYQA